MAIGQEVTTKHGKGTIVDIEEYSRLYNDNYRYGVKLENNPFSFPVAYYFKKDIS